MVHQLMHHCFFIRIPRRIRPLHRSCGPLPPATRGKRRHISAFRNQGRYRLRFFGAHRYTACIGLVEQAGFEPTTCAERSRQTLCAAPTSCATAPCMLNRNCAGAFAGASFTSRGLSEKRERRGCPYVYRDLEGGAGFEPTASGCACRCASESTSRPYRRRIGGR